MPTKRFRSKKRVTRKRRILPRISRSKTDYGTSEWNGLMNQVNRTYMGAQSAWQLGTAALRGLSTVAGLINTEKKVTDQELTLSNGDVQLMVGTATPALNLIQIAQGLTEATRIGNSALIKTIQIRGTLAWDSTLAGNQQVRMILVRMLDSDLQPTLAELLEAPTNIRSPLNINNGNAESQFSVISDKIYQLHLNRPIININKYMKTMFHAKFIGANGTDGALNRALLFIVSDAGNGTTTGPAVFIYSRVRYLDN